jgi:hypothetical protein
MAAENNAMEVVAANKSEQGTKKKEIQVTAEVTTCVALLNTLKKKGGGRTPHLHE